MHRHFDSLIRIITHDIRVEFPPHLLSRVKEMSEIVLPADYIETIGTHSVRRI